MLRKIKGWGKRPSVLLLTGLLLASAAAPAAYGESRLEEYERENLSQMTVTTPQEEIVPETVGGEGAEKALLRAWSIMPASDGAKGTEGARDESGYSSPLEVAVSSNKIYVADYTAGCVRVLNAGDDTQKAVIQLAERPTALRLSADGGRLYVGAGGANGKIYEIDTAADAVVRTLEAGHTPSALELSADGGTLYAANRFDGTLQVVDLHTGATTAVLPVTREPMSMVRTGDKLFLASHLITGSAQQDSVASDVVCIDLSAPDIAAESARTTIRLMNGSTNVKDMAVSPDGKYVYLSHAVGRYNVATTQADRGWIYNNAVTELRVSDMAITAVMMLDDLDLGAGNPWGVAATDTKLFVAISGTRELMIIDRTRMRAKIDAVTDGSYWNGRNAALKYQGYLQNKDDIANDLTFLTEMKTRVSLGQDGPRGLAVSEDGRTVYTANYFSGSLSAVSADGGSKRTVSFDTAAEDDVRTGERLWNDATIGYQQWQSCASCHPDARVDGLNWDNLNDGIGTPKQARSMLYTFKRGRVMATGIRANAKVAVRAGLKYIMFNANYPEEGLLKIDAYLQSLEPESSPYLVNGRLSESAQRGRALFDGQAGCAGCHAGELKGQDKLIYNYTQTGNETRGLLVPPLVEAWRTAPYLCDGRAATVNDVLTTFNPGYDQGKGIHGNVNDLSESQLEDLCNYVMSLSDEITMLTASPALLDFGVINDGTASPPAMTAIVQNESDAVISGLKVRMKDAVSFRAELAKSELAPGETADLTISLTGGAVGPGAYSDMAVVSAEGMDAVTVETQVLIPGELALSGSAVVGETMAMAPKGVRSDLSYQWYRGAGAENMSPIGGARQSFYTLTAADEGMVVKVEAARGGETVLTSSVSETVSRTAQTVRLQVEGVPRVGETLTAAVTGTDEPYTYRWLTGSTVLSNTDTCKIRPYEQGKVITVEAVCAQTENVLKSRLHPVLEKNQALVRMTVKDEMGDPLGACDIYGQDDPETALAVTGSDGRAEFAVGAGNYTFTVKNGGRETSVALEIGAAQIEAGSAECGAVLARGETYTLSGRFTAAGEYGARAELLDETGSVVASADLRAQKQKEFTLTAAEGSYTLRLTKPGHLSCTVREIPLRGDLTILEGLVLIPGKIRPGTSTIDFNDIAAMSGAFAGLFRAADQPDIDGDGLFTALDLQYVRQNYGKSAIDTTFAELEGGVAALEK
ncbi:c-type cytochrome [Bacilliculturomica massiliensis]|uniref:c-type cytochrome n=1 Tax=Bacilliculturomica massiliensis TaxID=1917867 RepID=UPI0013EF0866|nr:c-type cytochrome [Bacilliculturomica massiliensis]